MQEEERDGQRGVPDDLDVDVAEAAQRGDGRPGHAASMVPKTKAIIPEITDRKRVVRKPSRYRGEVFNDDVHSSFSCVGVGKDGSGAAGRRKSRPAAATRSVAVDRGRRGRLVLMTVPAVSSQAFCRTRPSEASQLVVDPHAEVGVVLLQADAVRLLGERLADQLEARPVLRHRPARMTLSVVTASTWPLRSASRHSEYVSNASAGPAAYLSGSSAPGWSPSPSRPSCR